MSRNIIKRGNLNKPKGEEDSSDGLDVHDGAKARPQAPSPSYCYPTVMGSHPQSQSKIPILAMSARSRVRRLWAQRRPWVQVRLSSRTQDGQTGSSGSPLSLQLVKLAAANSVAMASLCARYCLLRPPIPCHKLPNRSLHSRAPLKVRLRATRDGASLGSHLPCRTGAGSVRRGLSLRASVKPEAETEEEEAEKAVPAVKVDFEKDISKVVRKTAATFAPRASSAKNKNPAQPGTKLYSIFETQAYISMLFGGILSFNLLFPSDHPDIWRLMGMWSVWMFTIPSLRARDCPAKEKEALNYLFLAVPLINVTLPLVWKSFAAVWSADVIAFFAMYAWKLEWLGGSDNKANDSEQ